MMGNLTISEQAWQIAGLTTALPREDLVEALALVTTTAAERGDYEIISRLHVALTMRYQFRVETATAETESIVKDFMDGMADFQDEDEGEDND